MANRSYKQFQHTLENGIVKMFGKVTTSTLGAVGSSDCKGFSVAKTGSESGRYTVTLEDKFNGLRGASVIVEGAADAVYTDAKSVTPILRNVDVANSTLDIQFIDPTDNSDAELDDAAAFYIELTLKNSSAY